MATDELEMRTQPACKARLEVRDDPKRAVGGVAVVERTPDTLPNGRQAVPRWVCHAVWFETQLQESAHAVQQTQRRRRLESTLARTLARMHARTHARRRRTR